MLAIVRNYFARPLRLRQNEAAELSRKCTHMFVIGGHHQLQIQQKLCLRYVKSIANTVESLAKVGEITLENIDHQ